MTRIRFRRRELGKMWCGVSEWLDDLQTAQFGDWLKTDDDILITGVPSDSACCLLIEVSKYEFIGCVFAPVHMSVESIKWFILFIYKSCK